MYPMERPKQIHTDLYLTMFRRVQLVKSKN